MSQMPFNFSVQNVVINDGKILLVHEKDQTVEHKKRAGWGMFGGKTEGYTVQSTVEQIIKFLPVERIPEEDFSELLKIRMDDNFFSWFWAHREYGQFMPEVGQLVFLTAIRESIEETSFLVHPKFVLFEETTKSEDHRLIVVSSEIVSGTMSKRSLETDDCEWFDLLELPEGIYPSHKRRIALAVCKLGIRAKESGQLFDLCT